MEMQHKRKHLMNVTCDSTYDIYMLCDSCNCEVPIEGTSLDELNKAAEAHIREKEGIVTDALVLVDEYIPKQHVINFEDSRGEFLITDQVIAEMPFDNFVDFKHVMEQEVLERNLAISVEGVPDGILIKWKPKV